MRTESCRSSVEPTVLGKACGLPRNTKALYIEPKSSIITAPQLIFCFPAKSRGYLKFRGPESVPARFESSSGRQAISVLFKLARVRIDVQAFDARHRRDGGITTASENVVMGIRGFSNCNVLLFGAFLAPLASDSTKQVG